MRFIVEIAIVALVGHFSRRYAYVPAICLATAAASYFFAAPALQAAGAGTETGVQIRIFGIIYAIHLAIATIAFMLKRPRLRIAPAADRKEKTHG